MVRARFRRRQTGAKDKQDEKLPSGINEDVKPTNTVLRNYGTSSQDAGEGQDPAKLDTYSGEKQNLPDTNMSTTVDSQNLARASSAMVSGTSSNPFAAQSFLPFGVFPPMQPVEPDVTNTNQMAFPEWMRQDPVAFASGLASLWSLAAQGMMSVSSFATGNRQEKVVGNIPPFQEFLASVQQFKSPKASTPERPSVTKMVASPDIVVRDKRLAETRDTPGAEYGYQDCKTSEPAVGYPDEYQLADTTIGNGQNNSFLGIPFGGPMSDEEVSFRMTPEDLLDMDEKESPKDQAEGSDVGDLTAAQSHTSSSLVGGSSTSIASKKRKRPSDGYTKTRKRRGRSASTSDGKSSQVSKGRSGKAEKTDAKETTDVKETVATKGIVSASVLDTDGKSGSNASSSAVNTVDDKFKKSADQNVNVDKTKQVAMDQSGKGLREGKRVDQLNRGQECDKKVSVNTKQSSKDYQGDENADQLKPEQDQEQKQHQKSKTINKSVYSPKAKARLEFSRDDDKSDGTASSDGDNDGGELNDDESSRLVDDRDWQQSPPRITRELQQLLDSQTLIRYHTIRQDPPKTERFQSPVSEPSPRKKKSKEELIADNIKNEKDEDSQPVCDEKVENLGEIVWAKFGRQCWWPGIVSKGMYCGLRPAKEGYSWVFWFGDHKVSEVANYNMKGFTEEYRKFKSSNYKSKLFGKALLEAISECSSRCGQFEEDDNSLYYWADEGFPVDGRTHHELFEADPNRAISPQLLVHMSLLAERIHDDSKSSTDDIQLQRIENKHRRDDAFDKVRAQELDISEVCISCDVHSDPVVCPHPLFHGGLCSECKQELMETLFVYGDDNLNLYCVVCGNSGDMFVCDKPDCTRVYCFGCVDALVGEKAVSKYRRMDPWHCFMCSEYDETLHGLLRKKDDWQNNLIHFYQPNHVIQMPTQDFTKRPVRVLSLFDGISTGRHVLEKLGIEVDVYYSCEIDDNALQVARVRYPDNHCLGDITRIDYAKLKDIGPIDLVLGASPCNDLSLANPLRKGIYGGTGLLFFEFYRILLKVQSLNQDHQLFWLFENVKTMMSEAKSTISRFLECEPATWDAKMFSAQKRARYFWGNIPGMYCPPEMSQMQMTSSLDNVLTKDCNRTANVNKLRTVTTRPNSLRQGKNDETFPVSMNGQDDSLWIQELERVFGFPDHYTDVGNQTPGKRQKLLGKAWSVPVVKHLLLPLKQFFVTKGESDES